MTHVIVLINELRAYGPESDCHIESKGIPEGFINNHGY